MAREAIQVELESVGELLLKIYFKKLPLYENTEALFKTGGIQEWGMGLNFCLGFLTFRLLLVRDGKNMLDGQF